MVDTPRRVRAIYARPLNRRDRVEQFRGLEHMQRLKAHEFAFGILRSCVDDEPSSEIVRHHLQYYHDEFQLLGTPPKAYLRSVFAPCGVHLGRQGNENTIADVFGALYRFWAYQRDQGQPHIENASEDLPPLADHNTLARAITVAPAYGGSDGLQVGNPWFLDWRNRHQEAQLLMHSAKVPNCVATFECAPVIDYHMANYHRLRLTCGVSTHGYLEHVMKLGGMSFPECDQFVNENFASLYARWAGVSMTALESPTNVTGGLSLPHAVDTEHLLNRRGRGEGPCYWGDDPSPLDEEIDEVLEIEELLDVSRYRII
ncbi:hypothetical protein PUNSTDRAFT_139366 [Punctularia strigosozonata HHB-11173 SS5]|uniref:Uncharacterized protein n=1 Tax=Punctularia strigosozonata (strain HHB-11173) TaxID=741275 RepID=R7RZV7_PUNST|nr:uncharacterized protein PUNSTDRAFT_139366 [Punctularia strigosozonata HHB-11173 SS5]EIN03650.1 hypothetical protein PUNSTDRAFT_139366 [Punctularia strigosozonata HHB-11173 SS5]